ncbi:eukaryotic translation initiation factor 5 [Vermiconidia calcicola]|uniref:Eukaryotic translation initiation factor 5 n=1 Tax=Vermiconidia calcicola TaxID=1690605 RepID=A0ACC3NJV2_9PEZI|nr:eukaryotic translation initiation factor 5 [Vermiconidia calcicola]
MANVNIRRDVTDPFYRYKMERLQSKVEGKGNGIKTVIVNLSNVAGQLARPPSYVIKYFGFELGAQTNIDPKDDRWIINGAHESSKLQDHLDGFINKFVLCKDCKNPETVVQVKDANIVLDCKACGQRTPADMRHKLASFILKNQPKKGKKDKSTKKADRKARKEAEAKGDDEGVNRNGHPSPGDSGSDQAEENGDLAVEAGSDDELTRKINAGAKDLPSEPSTQEQEVQWSVDMSEEAVKARAKALPEDLKQTLVIDEDAEEGENGGKSAYDELGDWIDEQAKEQGSRSKISDVDIYKKAKDLGIESKHRTPTVLAMSLFDEKNVNKQIEARAALLKKMIGDSEKHQKAFLGGIERFVGEIHPALIPTVSAMLLPIFQEDIVAEGVIKGWGSKASKKYVDIQTSRKVRKSAEKFLEWLENAESDEDDDDDE